MIYMISKPSNQGYKMDNKINAFSSITNTKTPFLFNSNGKNYHLLSKEFEYQNIHFLSLILTSIHKYHNNFCKFVKFTVQFVSKKKARNNYVSSFFVINISFHGKHLLMRFINFINNADEINKIIKISL